MFLTITTTATPATDLGFLLHKNPGRVQSFDVSSGTAHVFYPVATEQRCTAALLLEVDPVATAGQYVNDRAFAASSLLAVALGRVFRTALTGRCDARPELALTPLPLELRVPVLPCRGGPELARRLFEPLGWAVQATPIVLDDAFPAWGDSPYVSLTLTGRVRVADALNQLYVLLPVLDDAKHYWVSTDEVDKLVRAGDGWLSDHPEKAVITSRYLAHQRDLSESALARLAPELELDLPEPEPSPRSAPLAAQRRAAVLAVLRAAGARRVGDLGCGEGALTAELLADSAFTEVVAADVSSRALQLAERRLRLDRMPEAQRARLRLIQSSLTYRDARVAGLDAIVLIEVIEHLDPPRLAALERSVFTDAHPGLVVITTPNACGSSSSPRASCGTGTIGSSGPAPSSPTGPSGWRPPAGSRCGLCPSASTTSRSVRPPRWPSSTGWRTGRG